MGKSDSPRNSSLKELLELLRSEPNITMGALVERWRDRSEGKHLDKLTKNPLPLGVDEQAREFRDTLFYLSSQSVQLEWEALVEKASQSQLNDQEKRRLSELTREKGRPSTPNLYGKSK